MRRLPLRDDRITGFRGRPRSHDVEVDDFDFRTKETHISVTVMSFVFFNDIK
jgi:hypothetical protein